MKSLSFILLVALFAGCGTSNTSSREVNDSTQQNVALPEDAANPGDEPDYREANGSSAVYVSGGALTETQAAQIDSVVSAMIEAFRENSFKTMESRIEHSWDFLGDYDSATAVATEDKTWYFDNAYRLVAFERNYTNDYGGYGSEERVVLYLFADDELSIVYDNKDTDGQIGVTETMQLAISQCPACGVTVTMEAGSEPMMSALSQERFSAITAKSREVIQEKDDLTAYVKQNQQGIIRNDSGEKFEFTLSEQQGEGFEDSEDSYMVNYAVDADLYQSLIRK